jgi:tetratricopeptide (TPR) repeat protein
MKTVWAWLVVAAAGILIGILIWRAKEPVPTAPPPAAQAPAPPSPAALDPAQVQALVGHMNRGLDALERYDYGGAAGSFRKAAEAVPGFYPAQFNYAISLVNDQKDPAAAENALRAAVVLAPKEAAPHYMLGMLLTQGVSPPRTKEAQEEFRAAAALAPDDADCHLRLGLSLREQEKPLEAEKEFSAALDINPFLGAALYQRGLNRQQIDRLADARADLEKFQEMQKSRRVDAREISYGFMGPLGNAVRDLDRWLPPAPEVEGAAVRYVDVEKAVDDATDPGGTIAVADLDGDGLPDLVFGGKAAGWRRNLGGWKFAPLRAFPAPHSKSFDLVSARDVVVADFDSDGNLDVAVEGGGVVMHADAEDPEVRTHPMAFSPGRLLAADLDADGDIDLVCGRTVLLNDGKGGLTPSPASVDLPAEPWTPLFLRDVDDDGFPDLVGAATWVRNLRGGSFGGEHLLPDALAKAVKPMVDRTALAFGDVDADGIDDRVVAVGDGVMVEKLGPDGNLVRRMHQAAAWALPESQKGGRARAAVFADFDGDGDLDLVVAQGGLLRFASNIGNAGGRTLQVRLAGVLHPNGRQFGWTNPRGIGARVEAIFGRRRVTRWMGLDLALDGKPAPDIAVFGLGPGAMADLVSIRWTEGVIQAEPEVKVPPGPPAVVVKIDEVQRKAASCPVVFSWDGGKFAFVADCMGGGGLGFLESPGTRGKPDAAYGKPDPTERVRIPASMLRARGGFYDVRLLEPLEEVTYADRLALTALDHPADAEAFPDERFAASGPLPGERVFIHRRADQVLPVKVLDALGADVTDRLARTDRVYAEGFDLHRDLLGFTAKDHWIDLDFGGRVPVPGEGERLILFLDGWIEYGYSRTIYAAAGAGVIPLSPTLELPDGKGGWKPGIADIGYPAGTPRTMTFDVTGVVGPGAPRFRIRSNLEIYWDRAWLAVDRGEGGLIRTTAAPAEARLRFAGFPREVSPDGREPKVNDYARMEPSIPGFKSMRGEYTRYGDVLDLVKDADDRYAIFRNGEEIALRFRASDFPPLREGWIRDFMLETVGWCKDMDYYTDSHDTVDPLPFLGMSAFPPKPGEAYPADEKHRAWRREWNTRVVR